MIRGVPELYDGGYWYVVPVVGTGAGGDPRRPDIQSGRWCAWYADSDSVATVRVLEPLVNALTAPPVIKPRARVGGR